jgi:cellulose synthase/poly-beta-1,6-N-acetylglucosamine synthase-like glycosyltransferase
VAILIEISQWFFLFYFAGLNLGYLALNVVSFFALSRYVRRSALKGLPVRDTGFEPPITIIVPAYNEEATIAASVRSLLQLDYPVFEIVVVNDGSRDRTLDVLKAEFDLIAFPEAFRDRLRVKPVGGVYRSLQHPQLRVIDKENGGKADALNAGVNASRYPLFCGLDADSVLQRDSLRLVVQPFLEDPRTVASGGIVRVANGCEVRGGFLVRAGLPSNLLALFQIVEYLRAFLFGRLGWVPLNALLIISGAFGVFHKETVIAAGGYRHSTIGEDMELVVRLHLWLRERRRAYRITFVPDPVCWTEAPEDRRVLRSQRMRWQRGLADSLMLNIRLLFHPRGGAVGWLAFPFMMLFELFGPLIEVAGYGLMTAAFFCGSLSWQSYAAFMLVAFGFGVLLSLAALLLEESAFRTYPKLSHLLTLFGVVLLENLGYRQLNAYWRLRAMIQWLGGKQAKWGEMTRTASWQSAARSQQPAPELGASTVGHAAVQNRER